jgi:hypothetical protein
LTIYEDVRIIMILSPSWRSLQVSRTDHTHTEQQKDRICTIRDIETKKVFLTEIYSIISNLTSYIQRGQGAEFEIAGMARCSGIYSKGCKMLFYYGGARRNRGSSGSMAAATLIIPKKFHGVTAIAIASSSFATSLSAVNKFSHKF